MIYKIPTNFFQKPPACCGIEFLDQKYNPIWLANTKMVIHMIHLPIMGLG